LPWREGLALGEATSMGSFHRRESQTGHQRGRHWLPRSAGVSKGVCA
jgi:hypothetical protein